jgi:hypothetical protein
MDNHQKANEKRQHDFPLRRQTGKEAGGADDDPVPSNVAAIECWRQMLEAAHRSDRNRG